MKKIKSLTLFLALALSLVGCGGQEKDARWNLTTEDLNSAIVLKTPDHKIDYENDTITYTFRLEDDQILANDIKLDDVIVFEKGGLLGSSNHSKDKTLYNSSNLLKASVTKNKLGLNNSVGGGKTLEIVTPLEATNQPSLIIDKKASPLGQYVIAHDLEPNDPAFSMDITDYSTEIVEQDFGINLKDVKAVIDFTTSIAMIGVGIAGESPSAIVSGVSSLFNTIFGLASTEVTNAQLLEEIKVIQQQLKEVINKLVNIKSTLETLQIITQCGFDQAKLLTLEGNWNAFIADYFDPINNMLTTYEQTFASYITSYVQQAEGITLRYEMDMKNKLTPLAPFDDNYETPDHTINLSVSDFIETKKYISHNVLTTGFVDGLLKDLEKAAPDTLMRKKGEIAIDAYNQIINEFSANVYFSSDISSDKYKLAQNIVNRFCDFADHISGEYLGGSSILNDALQRLTLIYNFAGEVSPIWTNFLATVKCYLTYFGQIAETAALNAHLPMQTMNEKIVKASDKIKELHNQVKNLDKNYSYVAGRKIEIKIGETAADTTHSGSENHPTISEKFVHKVIEPYGITPDNIIKRDLDWSTVNILDTATIGMMGNRYVGIYGGEPSMTFIDYLYEKNCSSWLTVYFPNQKNYLENMYQGFLTGIELRDMDAGTQLRCAWRSNGDYFKVGDSYTYRMNSGNIESQYWNNGKIMNASMVDAKTGRGTFNATLAGYARYWESHVLWFNDEIFGFTTTNPVSHYWFLKTA